MGAPADGWLERDGVSLHYLDWAPQSSSERQPPIFLLHGLSSNARYWERLAHRLPHRRLVALDQRGHGLTGQPPRAPRFPEGYGMEELLKDTVFAIDQLGLQKPVVVGHSWGATVALELVGTRQGIAGGLVFIDGPVQSAANLFSWEEAQKIMQPPLPRFTSFEEAVAQSKSDFEGAWDQDLESFVKARIVPDGEAMVLTLTAPVRLELLRGLYEAQPDVLWPRVDVPAAALLARHGPARIATSREAGAARLAELAPNVEISWYESPHDIPLYMPVETAAAIDRVATLAAGDASEATAG
ncbi:MAG TPA: alpha/beta hydrolase [Candidatus Dormibacteraeota bacterium]|nr:alpha/beta hydrolase [Candidatus Dormibacteraeota bacterium]